MLAETNIFTIESKRDYLTGKISKNLIHGKSTPLNTLSKSHKRKHRLLSTVDRAIQVSQKHLIPFSPIRTSTSKKFNILNIHKSTNINLSNHNKNTTPTIVFHQLFHSIKSALPKHNFLYTDGSKAGGITSYCITNESAVIKTGLLPTYSSVLSSEIIAIHEAILFTRYKRGKYAICTDSLSSITSIRNPNNHSYYASSIRNLLSTHFPKILIIWIPSHIGIKGNEFADSTARMNAKFPLIYTPNHNSTDIAHFLKKILQSKQTDLLTNTSTWYQQISNLATNNTPKNNILNRRHQVIFNRLRLGHTKLTNAHYIDKTLPNTCPLCHNANIDLRHTLYTCPSLLPQRSLSFNNNDPMQLIANPTNSNSKIILKFLQTANILHNI
ncbi:uncharacterized protein LOC117187974 [Drosophila miranda]|uniref:uncharacterized protein LOC117187974 n=1 Tax=Drosophila miranda TaxID=7229 RepID=UPI00143F893B|nr:uncharacterized protein LOC117187974 [Drosophila miranda]